MRIAKARPSGFTMLEVLIASVILMALTLMVFLLVVSSSNEEAREQIRVGMDARVLELLNLISEDIRNSGPPYSNLDKLGGDTPLQAGDSFYEASLTPATQRRFSLTLGRYSGFSVTGTTGTAEFKTVVRYSWRSARGEVPDNGKVDNKDGMADEGDIVREETTGGKTITSTICKNVVKRGLAFEMVGGTNPPKAIKVFIEVAGVDPKGKGKVMTARSSTSAAPRN